MREFYTLKPLCIEHNDTDVGYWLLFSSMFITQIFAVLATKIHLNGRKLSTLKIIQLFGNRNQKHEEVR